ncbi:hypothetical protein [Agromyces sp. LHK192]|uniref:hypothetical protein n=1 Tax=Agromyces sp. LHK192 TaxID=2498704 RepID=UPI000FD8598D|nr:hypothetical protein [Agromyces sp. LHK192]
MAEVHTAAPIRDGYRVVPIVRGILAIAPAIVITFSQDHSVALGQLVFGVWAVVSGVVVGALALRFLVDRGIRWIFAVQAVLTAIAGILSLIVVPDLRFLVVLVIAWAAATGVLELLAGLRAGRRTSASRDWLLVGGATALAAIAFLVFPFDPVSIVGLLGAYLVIVGVLLVIGGLSLKGDGAPAEPAEPAEHADPRSDAPRSEPNS